MTEFERIYLAYFRYVYLYIKSLSKDEHIAEDITSEAFMKAMKSIDSFNGTCDIRVWLCQIAKNCYFSYLRKNKKLTFTDTPLEQEDSPNVEQLVYSAEASMKIHEILHNLDEPYKEVFSLRIFGELSFKQIASLFGKSENWACVTYHRARKKIQERMEDYK
ncbi:MAG TPA: RNA polymerase subunit sigma [Clostridiaceae bacterium]|nr:RNA polymerase subunit sigma [Clostridiaceae bacterium]HBG37910.1 RNA polymerase subunit sigma [Clostridiaceae bacterium]HBN28142.1 RNA polymerase subunit sigma [Clostridiaceae bacterium]HCL49929.1 RNA polymerase subunit sigma [Clostridiaceae bacterium]